MLLDFYIDLLGNKDGSSSGNTVEELGMLIPHKLTEDMKTSLIREVTIEVMHEVVLFTWAWWLYS